MHKNGSCIERESWPQSIDDTLTQGSYHFVNSKKL